MGWMQPLDGFGIDGGFGSFVTCSASEKSCLGQTPTALEKPSCYQFALGPLNCTNVATQGTSNFAVGLAGEKRGSEGGRFKGSAGMRPERDLDPPWAISLEQPKCDLITKLHS